MMIDGDKLTAWLTEQKKAWADLVVGFLPEFEVERTPIDKISVPTKNRVQQNGLATSWEAAIKLTGKSKRMYGMIYYLLTTYGPMTDYEIRTQMTDAAFAHSWSGVSARRVELERTGWVECTGEKRVTSTGSPAYVWRAIPEK